VPQRTEKSTVPVLKWGVPIQLWVGAEKKSKSGSPRFKKEFVPNRGLTHIRQFTVLAVHFFVVDEQIYSDRKISS
jgi:hypothetical protein